jgi:hypothetical protein
MIIDVLICCPDGTEKIEKREVPDNWFEKHYTDGQ